MTAICYHNIQAMLSWTIHPCSTCNKGDLPMLLSVRKPEINHYLVENNEYLLLLIG